MGNKQALINHSSEISYASDFSDQIIEEGSKNHSYFGKINLWKITNSNRKRVFSKIFHVAEQNKSFPTIHIQRCSMKHQNLLNYYGCVKNTSKLLSNIESYEFYFEYLPETLNQHIKKAPFEEADIWMIIEQITDCMVYLQSTRRYHGKLSSEGIFMVENKKIKLLDDFLQNNLKQNKIKEDIYDFGLIIVQMMTQKTNQLNFFEQLKKLIGQYSLQLLQLTGKLLQKDPDQRPDFFQIQELISNRFSVPITLTEFIEVSDTPNARQNIRMITQDQFQQYKKVESHKQQEQQDPLFIQKTQPDIKPRESNQIINMKTVPDEKIQQKQSQSQNNIPSLDLKKNNLQQDTNNQRSQAKKINYSHKYSVDQIPQSYLFNYKTQIQKGLSQNTNSSRINKTEFDQQNDANFMPNQKTQIIQREDKKIELNSPSQIQQNNIAIKQITSRIQIYPQKQQNDVKLVNKPMSDQSNISTLHSMSRNMEFSTQYQSNYTSIQKTENFSSCKNMQTRPFYNNQYQ